MIRHVTLGITVALVAGFGAVARAGEQAAPRPNVLVIISDDAGYADIGLGAGGLIPTPGIDRIAQEGARFSCGYVTASVCSPSRAGLLTGQYQQRFGHEFNLAADDEARGLGLPSSAVTIAERLKPLGYTTAAFGKWHLGTAPGLQPMDQGFDVFLGLLEGSRSYAAIPGDAARGGLRDGRTRIEEPADLSLTDWLGARAADYLVERAAARDAGETAPFFAYLAYTAPHTPMQAGADDLRWAEGVVPEGASERRITYVAMTHALDRSIGTVLDALDQTGLAQTTLVIFLNDNGGATDNGSDNGPFRGMKGSKWEGGIRVPFAARWPGEFEPGQTFDDPVSSLDIAATVLAAAGGDVAAAGLDGVDLRALLDGDGADRPGGTLFWRRGIAAAARRGPWKLIRVADEPALLFDLSTDPGETMDVAGKHPDLVADLASGLVAWESGLAAPAWSEGEKWERNQRLKHRLHVIGRDAERALP